MTRGITTIAALKSRCIVDHATHCWLWQGACSDGHPRVHAFDHARGEKRVMPGTRAAWNVAFGEDPPAWALVYRGCQRQLCLNPAHLRLARDRADIGQHIRRAGTRKGTHLEARRANQRKACAAQGMKLVSPDVVEAIRLAPPEVTGRALVELHGVNRTTVSRIRRGEGYRDMPSDSAIARSYGS